MGVLGASNCLVHLTDEPYALERLEAVLKPIMWRNDKASVGDELVLKGRTLEVRSDPPIQFRRQPPLTSMLCNMDAACGSSPCMHAACTVYAMMLLAQICRAVCVLSRALAHAERRAPWPCVGLPSLRVRL